ncbi:MAG TPA: alpha/beta fold hydrolase [Thiotrichaceae bacterium]|jgi:esterase/lipase/1-acyl-sn-glycerol-3-phosphate acyltransferase|nr:alpha/beta fold hydrolase [Thiotrichaceae bacterium]HIM07110.1 alpha/beta fold hydrolase [Gammaproteobacteria bacterium]
MDEEYQLHPPTYEWTVRLFSQLRKVLGINIKLHGDPALLARGEIFLFNHFARIETFLPHYLIYLETGAFCRCIATKAIFKGNESFRKYLCRVGVIPNDHDELLPMLVAEIIRGRKVVIFPEGGMIKDRRVLDAKGKFSIYSHKAQAYRKHHAGAAVLANAVDTFKLAVRTAEQAQDWQRLDSWVEMLKLKNREHLLYSARRTTRIIPGNITFYPINTGDNFLNKGASLFNSELSQRVNEELTVEANLLLKNTDMDMRLGKPICLGEGRPWWERNLQKYMARNLNTVEEFFTLKGLNSPWIEKIIRGSIRHSSEKIRDSYMECIYKEVTVNLSHVTSTIILNLLDNNINELAAKQFYLIVYLAVKNIQQQPDVHLHRSLRNPDVYAELVFGKKKSLKQFLEFSVENGLIELRQGRLILLGKLEEEFDVDAVRIENTIQVYANEMAPVAGGIIAIQQAINEFETISDIALAQYRYDDELRRYDWNHHHYNKRRFDDINRHETATESGRPFFDVPKEEQRNIGIVLVHGFLASPAEMKSLSDKFLADGYPVYGVRLPGHGTSPVDLRERSWEDWLRAIEHGYEILAAHVDKIILVGFSTGGVLSLIFASERPHKLAATVVVNPPVKFKNKNMIFVPLLHGVSRLVRWAPSFEGIMPYRSNNPEHPRINYRNIPVRGLHELVRMNEVVIKQLERVQCPCLLMQSSSDPIITADSSKILQDGLINADVTYYEVDSNRHGILYENEAGAHKLIMRYVKQLPESSPDKTDQKKIIKEEHKWAS